VHENIFSGLALDESIAFRSIEPLHCSLFLHFLPLIRDPGFPKTIVISDDCLPLGPCPTSCPG
jgi:hypothetical protein